VRHALPAFGGGAELSQRAGTTLLVGVGHEARGDDAVGLLVAELLLRHWRGQPPAGVRVLAWRGAPLDLLPHWDGLERLVIIDALVTAGSERPAPGTLQRLSADAPFVRDAGASSHGFGVAEALALAQALGRAPRRVQLWGIEAGVCEVGAPLHPAVVEAALALARRLAREFERPRRGRGVGGVDATLG